MAAPWEDVRDVLVRVGFGSPRPSTSSDEIIHVTRERPRGRGADGQRQKSDASSSSRRRRRNTRTSKSDSNSPMASMLDVGDVSTPLPRTTGSNSSTPADRQVRISTTAMSSRARNRARGVRPVHQSPSQLLLDLTPAVGDAEGARQQGTVANKGDGDDDNDETAAALFAEALSPIVPIPRRTSSMAALSDYGEQTNGSDVDLSEVHDMVDQIQRDLTEDLRTISTSINNYDDNNDSTNIAKDDTNGDDGSSEKAEGGQEGRTNVPEAVSCANDESSVESSTSTGADSTGNEIKAKTIATTPKADQSSEIIDTPTENDQTTRTEHLPLTRSHCKCDCHKMPSSQNDVVEAEQTEAITPPKYKYPIPTRESADSPARALCQTADEIQRRAEVAGVLSCMITGVEQAHWLASDLRHRSEVTCLEHQLQSAQRILSERRLVEQSEQERRKALGDHLLVELMSMGARLADAESYKIEMGEETTENERLNRQLASALDQIKKVEAERDNALAAALKDRTLVEIEEMKEKGTKEQNAEVDEDWLSLKNGSKPEEEPVEIVEVQMPNTKEGGASVGEPPKRVKSTDFGALIVKDQQRDHQNVEGKSRVLEVKEEPLTEGVLSPLLVLPERGLMVLFSFLEAEEILSVAELNVLMYSRVDTLFGLGGEASNQEEGTGIENNQDLDETHEGHLSAPTVAKVPPPPSGPDEGAGPGRPIEPREAAPRIGLAGQAQESAHIIGSAVGNAVSNLLWQRNLQRERNASTNGTATSSSLPIRDQNEILDDATRPSPNAAANAGSDAKYQSSTPLLTAGLASKIASKLSPQELSVIIEMRTKINQLEDELVKGKERQDG